ncbi:MAG: hypothetical protein ACWGQW_25995 [bacterium]
MDWTIQDWGAAGEFIASLAVLVTLIVLVVQVRQTNQAVRDNSYQLTAQVIYESFDIAASSEHLVRANAKDQAGESLSADERLAVTNYWRSLIRRAEAFHYQSQRNLVSSMRLDQFGRRLAASYNKVSRLRAAWKTDESTMMEDFRRWAEGYFES